MTNPDSRQHIGRRTLVHSAWAVPAVSIAAAAPAYAATNPRENRGNLTVTVFSGLRLTPGFLSPYTARVVLQRLQVRNDSTNPVPAGSLIITVDMPDEYGNTVSAWTGGNQTVVYSRDTRRTAQWQAPTYGANTIEFIAQPGYGLIPAGGTLDILGDVLDNNQWAWTTTTDARGQTMKVSASAWGTDPDGDFYFTGEQAGAGVTIVPLGVFTT